jgi:hypothetical protein
VYCGTVNINEGAFLKLGGNQNSTCNYIGVDNDANAAVNINGGTLWCAASNGSGYLGIGINSRSKAYSATLTLNSGTLKVDGQIRSAVGWNSAASANKTGTVTINGGTAEVGQFVLGSTSGGTGSSVLNLNGGSLTLNEMYFRACNGQSFTWGNGSLVAGAANVFRLEAYTRVNSKTRTMQITGAPASFDTAGFAQTIPAFTGTGRLRLTGGGAVTFSQSTLTYGLIFDGITLNLGTLDAGTTPITTPNLEIIGPATLNVTLPESPSGRYPLIACTLFLVPGIPLINAVDDLLNNFIVAGMTRAMHTLLVVGSMTFGIVIAIRLCGVTDFTSVQLTPDTQYLSQAIAAAIAATGFSIIFNVPKRILPVVAVGGIITVLLRNISVIEL